MKRAIYNIVRGDTHHVEATVNELIRGGWETKGPLVVLSLVELGRDAVVAQVMTKVASDGRVDDVADQPPAEDDRPIEELPLSCRAYNGLKNAGIETVGQIQKLSDKELLQIKHLGRRSLHEIRCAVPVATGQRPSPTHLRLWIDGALNKDPFQYPNASLVEALSANGIKRFGDLVVFTERELRDMPGIGDGFLSRIKKLVADHGLRLGMSEDDVLELSYEPAAKEQPE